MLKHSTFLVVVPGIKTMKKYIWNNKIGDQMKKRSSLARFPNQLSQFPCATTGIVVHHRDKPVLLFRVRFVFSSVLIYF